MEIKIENATKLLETYRPGTKVYVLAFKETEEKFTGCSARFTIPAIIIDYIQNITIAHDDKKLSVAIITNKYGYMNPNNLYLDEKEALENLKLELNKKVAEYQDFIYKKAREYYHFETD